MALQITVTTPHGFEAVDAYHRVTNVVLLSKTSIQFDVQTFKNAQASQPFEATIFLCEYDLNDSNPIMQAYKHLKTLPEFAGAADC